MSFYVLLTKITTKKQYFCIMNPTNQTIGDGTRIFHFIIDTLLIFILAYYLHQWYNLYVFYAGYWPIRFGEFFFIVYWGYVFLFEFIFCKTPAKWITGTKVVSNKGSRPTIFQFLIRASIHTSIISMFGMAWNGKPWHDTFSKTQLINY